MEAKNIYDLKFYERMLRLNSRTAEDISTIRWRWVNKVNPDTVLDYGSGVGFSEEDNMEIRDIFFSNDFIRPNWETVGQMTRKNLKNEYRDYLSSKITLKRQLKVVIDCGNGSSCLSAPEILKSIGGTIELVNSVPPQGATFKISIPTVE